ncbi:hypothetical protein TRICI_003469 [Trichomonascus ciferrii]|uniref:Nucleolar protein 9 n=1 Tax=Trichomonascus ciferrii TaxID=44093 RepID=A0A642V3V7_9ASCO|nr:hypothetical protein TRICI_003469 [Trichomonascus ciferrii]
MPKAAKVRGRRAEAQKKKQEVVKLSPRKDRRRLKEDDGDFDVEEFNSTEIKVFETADDYEKDQEMKDAASAPEEESEEEATENGKSNNNEGIFFGLVDRQELEYFKQAESTMAVDGFASPEERTGFINGVFEEIKGKELKLVTSQICSKLIERLILTADEEQLRSIFSSFIGHFLALSKHKYSSHCVETLLVRSAALVEKEMVEDNTKDSASMESLFLKMFNELKPALKQLPTNPYASHVLRLVILILAGERLPSTTSPSVLRSKKSKVARKMIYIKDNQDFERSYQVPISFKEVLDILVIDLANSLDTTAAREMAIDKIASPVVQLIIQVEKKAASSDEDKKSKKRRKKEGKKLGRFASLIFCTSEDADSKEQAFVEYLLSDPVGSHFFEQVIPNLPLPTVQRLYKLYMKGRMEKLARRDAGNFVVQAMLKKLSYDEVQEILDALIPELEIYINSTVPLARSIIESATQRKHKLAQIEELITKKYSKDKFLDNILKLSSSTLGQGKDGDWPTSEEMHRSLLVQTLIDSDSKFRDYALDGFLDMDKDKLISVAKHSIFSHTLEKCLVPSVDIIKRKKILNSLSGSFVELSCNAYGSHIMDKLWRFTYKLKFFRERFATELTQNEQQVKHDSKYGRSVWRNWNLDKYVRKRFEWWKIVKEEEDKITEELKKC